MQSIVKQYCVVAVVGLSSLCSRKLLPESDVIFFYEEEWRHALFAVSVLSDRITNNFHIVVSFASLLGPHTYLVRQYATRFLVAYLDTSSQHRIFVKRRRIPPNCLLSRPLRKTSE